MLLVQQILVIVCTHPMLVIIKTRMMVVKILSYRIMIGAEFRSYRIPAASLTATETYIHVA